MLTNSSCLSVTRIEFGPNVAATSEAVLVGQTWVGVKLLHILMKIFKLFKKNFSRQKDVMVDVIKVTLFSRNSQKEMTIK
jgi:hypothetical protein